MPGPDPLGMALEQDAPADRASRILELRQKTGLAADVVDRNFDELDLKDRNQAIDVETLRKMSPALGAWLAEDATRAAAAKPEIGRLQQLEQHAGAAAPLLRGIDNLQGLLYGATEWAGETLGLEELTTFGREGRERNREEAAAYGHTPSLDQAFSGPREFSEWLYNVAGEQLPMMAPSLVGGGTGAAVGSTFGPGGTVIGGLLGAFVPGLVLGIGEQQSTLKEKDTFAVEPTAVFLGGTAIAALDTALPGKVGGRLVKTFGKETAEQIARRALTAPVKQKFLKTSLKGAVTGMATEGITEAIQEAIGEVTGNAAAGLSNDWGQIGQAMLEAGAAGAVVGGGVEGATSAIESRRHNARVMAAEQQAGYFKALGDGVVDSELVKRSPQAVQDFLARATKDGPVETIYAPTDTFEEYWQSKGQSPDVIAAQLTGDRDALARAKREGTKLAIPTAAYAVNIAPTEHHAFFAKELTLRPQLLNIRETQELEESVAAAAARPQTADEETRAGSVAEVARRFASMSVAQGAPRWQAEAWGQLMGQRYAKRALIAGVDPLELWEQQPRELVIQEASGASLIPQPVVGERNELGIPRSPAPRGETGAQRKQRRLAHVSALAASVVRDATTVEPNVDPAQIRAELDFRIQSREEQDQLQREAGQGQQLLRAIAGYGGLWWDERSGHFRGEVEGLIESGRDIKGTAAGTGRVIHQAGRATYNGVPGVFREGGLPIDTLRERLAQDPEFADITGDVNELLDAIDEALRARPDVDEIPGSEDLRSIGVVPGTAWWLDSWRPADVPPADVDVLGDQALELEGELDDSFNPDEFEQRTAATAEDAIARLPDTTVPNVPTAAKAIPFPAIPDQVAEQLYRASFGLATVQVTEAAIPIKDIVATQSWVFPDTVRAFLEAADAPPALAMLHEGRYYLTDGHHKAAAAWARGEATVPGKVAIVDAAALERELAPPGGGTAGPPIVTPEANDRLDTRQMFKAGLFSSGSTTAVSADEGFEARQRIEDARAAARAEVDKQFGDEFHQLTDRNTPLGFEVIAPHLTEDEAAKLRRDTAQRLIDIWSTLPSDADFKDAAVAGAIKRGWYERSTAALQAVFGPVDSVRFAALLAALSPQTGVQTNLLNALRMWIAWDSNDRPTSKAEIRRLLAASVRGAEKGRGDSVLPSWVNNVFRVLQAEDAGAVVLSGPKVNSFARNLWGHLNEVTNDTWMANFALVDQAVFGGELNAAGTDPGKTPGYLALSAKIRRVAKTLTRETGETWTAAHVQETIWSWAKTLYELADAQDVLPSTLLREGGLTDAAIAQTPDFAQLFAEDRPVREILEAAGYGDVIRALERTTARAARRRDAAAGQRRARAGAASGAVSPGILRSARRLDELQRRRRAEQAEARLERQFEIQRKQKAARIAARKAKRSSAEFNQRRPQRQIDTPAFTSWFGESVVTEADGEPRVVYHGTWDPSFDVFRTPSFFSNDPAYASRFSRESMALPDEGETDGPNYDIQSAVMPVYLSIQKPLDLRALGIRELTAEQFLAALTERGVELDPDLAEVVEEWGTRPLAAWAYVRRLADVGLMSFLSGEYGIDGIAQRENLATPDPANDIETEAWVVYKPEQIKSATGNSGAFDAMQSSIVREQLEPYALADVGPDDPTLPRPLMPGEPHLVTRTELVTLGSRMLGSYSVRTAADAAAAVQYLGLGAVERFDALVVDANGQPLAIVGSFKGRVDAAPIQPDVILAEALQVKGAAAIWFAHNHPSGDPRLSPDDRSLNHKLVDRFRDTGIEAKGILAITSGDAGVQQFMHQDETGMVITEGPVRSDGTELAVPIREREFVATGKLGDAITSPTAAVQRIPSMMGGQFGVVLLDTRLRPLGTVPLDVMEARKLREGGKLRQLYTTASESGAAQAIVYTPDRTSLTVAFNVARALSAQGIHAVDVVTDTEALGPDAMKLNVEGEEFFAGEGDGEIQGGFNPSTGRMRLIAGAQDLSTFLHESGHAFLDELLRDALGVDLAAAGTTDLQRQLVKDAQTALRWFGFEGTIAEFLELSVDEARAHHEQWATGFESYLMTGEAPSHELRQLFATFRAWLVAVYKVLRRHDRARVAGMQLPADVRAVMDRLLATDEAIAAVRSESVVDALFTDAKSAGVDELTFAAYQQQIVDANRAAREQLDRRLLEDWRRERAAWWQQEREGVKQQVEQEAQASPVVIATSVIRTGKLPDGTIPPFGDGRPLKLSKKAIVGMMGADFVKRLPKPYLYSAEGGLHPDVVAELTGFSSGQALLESLLTAKPVRPIIDAEADRRMRQKWGDVLLDGMQLDELAEQAIHSNREQVISAELKALTQGMAAAAIPSTATLRQAAAERIARTAVRDLKPGLFLQAAQRSSRQAFDAFARNDRAAAVKAKQQELTSLALYRAAAEAKDRADSTARLLGEFQTSKGRRKTLLHAGEDYLDQVDAILERYQFTKSSQKQIDRRISLRKWIEKQQAAGLEPQIEEWLIDDARTVHYRELTVEELEGVRATVEQIAHLARLKDKLLKHQDQRTLSEIVEEINASIRANFAARPRVYEPRAAGERSKRFAAGVFLSHRKIASIARQLDGLEDGGAMWTHVIQPINEAGNREASMMAGAGVAVRKLFEKHYTAVERAGFGDKVRVQQLEGATSTGGLPGDVSLSKEALLALALNQGNEQNRQRLRDGYGWSQEQIAAALDAHLDRRDWQFVQDVWDYIDTYWPAIVEKQGRVIGVPPEKVQPTPVFTRFGEFRGGYYPIKFERELSGKIQNLEDAAAADMMKAAAYVHATTARGHLERRAEGPVTEHPVRLDLNVMAEHLHQVIHDLTHHEMLMDVGRILSQKEVETAIRESLGPAAYDQFRRALKDIAIGDVPARHEAEGLLGYLRNGATIAGLGWNLTTSAVQFIGLTQSIHRIGAVWVGRGMVSFLRGAAAMDGTIKANLEESELLRNRGNTMSPEVANVRAHLGIDTGRFTGWVEAGLRGVSGGKVTKQGIADSFLWMIAKTQQTVDHMTYMGAKAKAAADPANLRADGTLDEARVIAIAEQAVLDSQGGGQIKDLAAVQRGPAAWKLWINFYSFFNTTYNAWAESVHRAGGRINTGRHAIAVGRLAVDAWLLFTLPTVLNHLVRSALVGELGDELEDPQTLIKALAREQLSYMAGMMVILRELGGVIEGRWGNYEGPAGARGLATLGRAVTQTFQGDTDEAFWRAWNATGGVFFHYPAGQVDRTVRGMKALIDGETSNPAAVLFGPPRR
jgi:hypothetical protein